MPDDNEDTMGNQPAGAGAQTVLYILSCGDDPETFYPATRDEQGNVRENADLLRILTRRGHLQGLDTETGVGAVVVATPGAQPCIYEGRTHDPTGQTPGTWRFPDEAPVDLD